MKSLLRASALVFSAAFSIVVAADSAPLRVMSCNVRLSAANDGEDAWPKRREFLLETIARYAPDLIGFQEVLEDQHDAIVERMTGYGFSGVARNDGKRSGEWSNVGFRKDRFELLDSATFWLSEQPEVPGSKSWDAAITRICTWVQLREKTTGREFYFANTHFDHRGVVARVEAARLISARLSQLASGGPMILTGDFNVTEDTPPYATLVRPETPGAIKWIDAFRVVHPTRSPDEASFHGFNGTTKGSRIDFVFHTAHFSPLGAAINRSQKEGRYPSDHYPVTAELRFR
ncbi:MAG: endonuclease/exonuclease/phosphatase family protein [Opitutaceae bacterium]|nr:endonuclease/exonuclease/phosphatase family protein [Opitutaceae bacterium]